MRYLVLTMLAAVSLSAFSQHRTRTTTRIKEPVIEKSITDRYIDSLNIYKHRQDSLNRLAVESDEEYVDTDLEKSNPRFARLFTPLQFYPDLIHRRFSLSPDEMYKSDEMQSIDQSMMDVYIYHPQLVKGIYRPEVKKAKKELAASEKKIETAPTTSIVVTPEADERGFHPVGLVIKKPNFWKLSGEFYFQTMQNYYSQNWYQGGESSYSVLARATLQANYNNKQRLKWDNKLEMQLGLQTSKSDTVHNVKTSTDLVRYTGNLGIQASKKWYYTLQLVASSQFLKGFPSNSHNEKSGFLSPLNLNLSVGMDYSVNWLNNKLTGNIHLAPLAIDYKYVDRLALATQNGLEEGHHSKTDYGSTFTLNAKWVLSDNITWNTRLYGFTSYKRTDIQWENTINMKISKVITTSIYIYPRFDDSNISRKDGDYGYFQLKEYTSIGLAYAF